MTIKDHPEGKIIVISKPFGNRSKVLSACYFVIFFCAGTLFSYGGLKKLNNDINIANILLTLITIGMVFAAFRLLRKAAQFEDLIVSRNNITIVKGGLFTKQQYRYEMRLIENFRHEVEFNNLQGNSKVVFNYKGRTIALSDNIYSWEFNNLAVVIYDITGYDFLMPEQPEEMTEDTENDN